MLICGECVLGDVPGVPTPAVRTIVDLVCGGAEVDRWRHGRTVGTLGRGSMSAAEMRDFVAHDSYPARSRHAALV